MKSILFASDKTRELLDYALLMLGPDHFETTLMRKNHGEYLLDAYNFDQLPRYFFGLELNKLKKIFSKLSSTRDMFDRAKKPSSQQVQLTTDTDLLITIEQFIIAMVEVIDVKKDNIVYVLNGARELFDRLSDRNDGKNIRFNDFIQLYISSQTDHSQQGTTIYEFNKDKEYFIQECALQDNIYHSQDLKKIQFGENKLAVLDYSSTFVRILDPITLTVKNTLKSDRKNHPAAAVINDFYYSLVDNVVCAVYQDQSLGFWNGDDANQSFGHEEVIFSNRLQLKVIQIESAQIWFTVSSHDEIVQWDLVDKTYQTLKINLKSKICEIREIFEKQIVGIITFNKQIVFYNNRLRERLMEIKGSINFQNFLYVPRTQEILTYAYDNTIVTYKVDQYNSDATKLSQFGVCPMNKMVLAFESFVELELLLTIDEEGDLKSWNLYTHKFVQKINLKMQRPKSMIIQKLSAKRFVIMGKKMRFYEFLVVSKDKVIELKPFKMLYFDMKRVTMYLATNFEIKCINLNNASILDCYTQETSNINQELKGFFVDSLHQRPFAFNLENILHPVVYKEKLIQNYHYKAVERHLTSDIQQLVLVESSNEIIAVGNNKLLIYLIEENQSTVFQRSCDISIDKLNENIIKMVASYKINTLQEVSLLEEQNPDDVYKYVFEVVKQFTIKNIILRTEINMIFIQLSFDLIIICRFSDFHFFNSFYLRPMSIKENPKSSPTHSLKGSQRVVLTGGETNQIKYQFFDMCRSYFKGPSIINTCYIVVDDYQILLIAEESILTIWCLDIRDEPIKPQIKAVLKLNLIDYRFTVPITTMSTHRLKDKILILFSNISGYLMTVDLTHLIKMVVCQGQSVEMWLTSQDHDFDDRLFEPIEPYILRESNKGRYALSYNVLINALPIQISQSKELIVDFSLPDTKKLIPVQIIRAHSTPILSTHIVDFQEELIITLSSHGVKLWDGQLQLMGSLDLLTLTKESWKIQMLNKNTKQMGLEKTQDLVTNLLKNLVEVRSEIEIKKYKQQSIMSETTQSYKKRIPSNIDDEGLVKVVPPITSLFLPAMTNSRLIHIKDQIAYKQQRIQISKIPSIILKPITDPIVESKVVNKFIQNMDNKFNNIYKSSHFTSSRQNTNLRFDVGKSKREIKVKIPLMRDTQFLEKQSSPDYLDYLTSKFQNFTNMSSPQLINEFMVSPKYNLDIDMKQSRARDLQQRSKAKKQMTQDFSIRAKFNGVKKGIELNVFMRQKSPIPSSLSSTQIGYKTHRQSQSNIIPPISGHQTQQSFRISKENKSQAPTAPTPTQDYMEALDSSKLLHVDQYLTKAKDLMLFLEIKNHQMGIF